MVNFIILYYLIILSAFCRYETLDVPGLNNLVELTIIARKNNYEAPNELWDIIKKIYSILFQINHMNFCF